MSDINSVRSGRAWLPGGAAVILVAGALAALVAVGVTRPSSDWVAAAEENTIAVPDFNGGHQTSLVLDAAGYPVVAYRRDAIGSGLAVLHCGNADCSAGNSIVTADPAVDVGYEVSLALDAAGNPVVSYVDRIANGLKVLHCGDPNCSAGNSITSPATGLEVYSPTSLALDGDGFAVISYTHVAGADDVDLKVLHCGDPNCSAGNVTASPDSSGDVGYSSALALDAAGNPVVVYLDADNNDLKVLHCGDANCSAGNSITVADPHGGGYTSLELGPGGNPVISSLAPGNQDLNILRCSDPNCGSVTRTSPDTDGDVGEYTSLALDADGNPVVSYHYVNSSDLKVLHCGNPACSSGNAITAIDTPNSSGWFTSLALDGSGRPVVSYSDPLVGLKVLRCGDVNCGAVPAPTLTPTASPGPGDQELWGDSDCAGDITTRDNQALLRKVLQQAALSQTEPCPDIGSPIPDHSWGDWDCNGDVTTRDNQALLRKILQQAALGQTEPCPDLDTVVDVS